MWLRCGGRRYRKAEMMRSELEGTDWTLPKSRENAHPRPILAFRSRHAAQQGQN
jgi:hypothetical protein